MGQTFEDLRTVPSLAIVVGVTVMPPTWVGPAAASLALVLGLAVLQSARRAILPTTLASAWWWTVVALCASCFVHFAAALAPRFSWDAALPALRLAAAALSLCPIVCLLGAKRPQHRAWNFVVPSLWCLVALAAAEAVYFQRGPAIDVGAARSWFLWILILLPPINFVPTRFAVASLVLFAGQLITFSPHLALIRRPLLPEHEVVSLLLELTAMATAWIASRRATAATNRYDRVWLDFRDTFGLFWALRVQERVDAAARQCGWKIRLAWRGLRAAGSDAPLAQIDASVEPVLRTTLKGL